MAKATPQGDTCTDPGPLSSGEGRGERRLCKSWEKEGAREYPRTPEGSREPCACCRLPLLPHSPSPIPGPCVPACLAGERRTHGDPNSMSTLGPGERSTPARPSYAKKKRLYTGVADFIPSQSSSHGIPATTLHQYLTCTTVILVPFQNSYHCTQHLLEVNLAEQSH